MVVVCWCIAAAASLAVMVGAFKTGRPIRHLIGGALQGVCAVAAVNVTGAFTGVSLGLNAMTGGFCLLGGVPGVVTLLLLKVIFQI